MIFISVLTLSTSLSLIIGSSDFFYTKTQELNSPHYANFIYANRYKDDFLKFAAQYPGTVAGNVQSVLLAEGIWVSESSTTTSRTLFINNSDFGDNTFYTPEILEASNFYIENMIFLPLSFKIKGFEVGDGINLDVAGEIFNFTISGFFEDSLIGSGLIGTNLNIVYVSNDKYSSLESNVNYTKYKCLSLRFENPTMDRAFRSDFFDFAKLERTETIILNYSSSESAAMTFINFLSVILVVFSFIILVVAFVVVIFSINSSINEGIITIGLLKSIGYKNKHLRCVQAIQYLLISIIGSILGVVTSFVTFEFVGNIITSVSGLLWINNKSVFPSFITLIIIWSLTISVVLLSTREYKKITPVDALRKDRFKIVPKKNIMPISKYNLPLNLHLGIKRLFSSFRSNLTLSLCLVFLVFMSLFVNAMSYNMNTDNSAMIRMLGVETNSFNIRVRQEGDIYEIQERIDSDEEVNKTLLMGSEVCFINGSRSNAHVIDYYEKLEVNTILSGKNPNSEDEVTLGASTSRLLNKNIGDNIVIEINGIIRTYSIVGIMQNLSDGGENCRISIDAMQLHYADFKPDIIFVYLNTYADSIAYYNNLKSIFGNTILITNTGEQISSLFNAISEPIIIITIIMAITTVIIVSFVLFLMISTLLRKSKREFGIMKAIGCKNSHLIYQVLVTFSPALLLGTFCGMVLVIFITNPLLSVSLRTVGLLRAYFIIPVFSTIILAGMIFGASILVVVLLSLRLRGISPQKMIVE